MMTRENMMRRKKLIKPEGEIDNPTIIAGDLNIPHPLMDRTTRQKT